MGTKIWARQIGSVNNEEAYDVEIDSENNLYITGWSNKTWKVHLIQTKKIIRVSKGWFFCFWY